MRIQMRHWPQRQYTLFLCIIGVAIGCQNTKKNCDQAGQCPTPQEPQANLQCGACVALVAPPEITQLNITPFGGKVPIEIEFSATVQAPYPEVAPGMILQWDIDGQPGVDYVVAADKTISHTYESCRSVAVSVYAQDRFGRRSQPLERSLLLNCNQKPVIDFFAATVNAGPPTAKPGENVQFRLVAYDPDRQDANLAGQGGIKKVLLDPKGDGNYLDATMLAAGLPYVYQYEAIGQYRPSVRVYDDNDDWTDSSRTTVQIVAQDQQRGRLVLKAPVYGLDPRFLDEPLGNSDAFAFAWGQAGVGIAAPFEQDSFYVRANAQHQHMVNQVVANDVRDVVWLQHATIGASGDYLTVDFLPESEPEPTFVTIPQRCVVADTSTPQQLWQVDLTQPQQRKILIAGNRTQQTYHAWDATTLQYGQPEDLNNCLNVLTPYKGGGFSMAVSTFTGATFWQDVAVLNQYLFAAVSSGQEHGVIYYDMATSATQLVSDCANELTHCLVLPERPTAIAAQIGAPTSRLAVASGQLLRIYELTFPGPQELPHYQLLSTTNTGKLINQLAFAGSYLVALDRQGAYQEGLPTLLERQPKGIYLAPVTQPEQMIRVLPPVTTAIDDANYPGPYDVVTKDHQVWIADGHLGAYAFDAAMAFAAATSEATVALNNIERRWLSLPESSTAMAIDPISGQAYLGLTAGLAAVALNDPDGLTFAWWLPSNSLVRDVAVLSGPSGVTVPTLLITKPEQLVTMQPTISLLERDVLLRPLGRQLLAADFVVDPNPNRDALAIFYELDDEVHYGLQAIANDGTFDTTHQLLIPDDYVSDPGWLDVVLPVFLPPLGRLIADAVYPRVLFTQSDAGDRICINPFWGENCPGDFLLDFGLTGVPYYAKSHGEEIIFYDNAKTFTVVDQDGRVLIAQWRLCDQVLGDAEQQLCLAGYPIRSIASADPYWLVATGYGLFVIDLNSIYHPQVVASRKGQYGDIAAWLDGADLHVLNKLQDGNVLELTTVKGVRAP